MVCHRDFGAGSPVVIYINYFGYNVGGFISTFSNDTQIGGVVDGK